MNVTFETPIATHELIPDERLADFIALLDLPEPYYLIMQREGAAWEHYIQSMALPEGGYNVNYREGSWDKHYETIVQTRVQVALLFFAYLHHPGWPEVLNVQWEKAANLA